MVDLELQNEEVTVMTQKDTLAVGLKLLLFFLYLQVVQYRLLSFFDCRHLSSQSKFDFIMSILAIICYILMVIKEDAHQIIVSGVERAAGTLLGAVIAISILGSISSDPIISLLVCSYPYTSCSHFNESIMQYSSMKSFICTNHAIYW